MIKSTAIRLASGRFDMIGQEQQQQSSSNNNNNTLSLDEEEDIFFDAHCHLPSSSSSENDDGSDHQDELLCNNKGDLTLSSLPSSTGLFVREDSIRLDRVIGRGSSIIRRNHTLFDKHDQTTLDGSARTADTTTSSSRSSCSRVRFAPDVVTEVWKCIQEHDSLSDNKEEGGATTHQPPKGDASSCSAHSWDSHSTRKPLKRHCLLRSFSESQISFVSAVGHKQQQCSNKRSTSGSTSSAVKFLSTPISFMKKTRQSSQKKVSMYY